MCFNSLNILMVILNYFSGNSCISISLESISGDLISSLKCVVVSCFFICLIIFCCWGTLAFENQPTLSDFVVLYRDEFNHVAKLEIV